MKWFQHGCDSWEKRSVHQTDRTAQTATKKIDNFVYFWWLNSSPSPKKKRFAILVPNISKSPDRASHWSINETYSPNVGWWMLGILPCIEPRVLRFLWHFEKDIVTLVILWPFTNLIHPGPELDSVKMVLKKTLVTKCVTDTRKKKHCTSLMVSRSTNNTLQSFVGMRRSNTFSATQNWIWEHNSFAWCMYLKRLSDRTNLLPEVLRFLLFFDCGISVWTSNRNIQVTRQCCALTNTSEMCWQILILRCVATWSE